MTVHSRNKITPVPSPDLTFTGRRPSPTDRAWEDSFDDWRPNAERAPNPTPPAPTGKVSLVAAVTLAAAAMTLLLSTAAWLASLAALVWVIAVWPHAAAG